MNFTHPRRLLQQTRAAAALLMALSATALAGPGAHGPNGEHLDSPSTVLVAPALPRLEAKSEAFELVAELRATELTVLIDRHDTNEPVLGARLEVESGGVKALAAYHPDDGDYVVTDAALLKLLASPGEHGLVFTLVAGTESDLLDGTLVTAGAAAGHDDHDHHPAIERAAFIGGGVAALALLGAGLWWRGRRSATTPLQEAV